MPVPDNGINSLFGSARAEIEAVVRSLTCYDQLCMDHLMDHLYISICQLIMVEMER